MISRHRAMALLLRCDGEEIWEESYCREQGVPEEWIRELVDTFESGFRSNRQTIFVERQIVNQYRGVKAVDLAMRCGAVLGVDVDRVTATALSRAAIVRAIREALEE
jgi:hypothetical protein